MTVDRQFFLRAVPGAVWVGNESLQLERFVLDSRLVTHKATFVALQGERVDGHDFFIDALEKGANSCIVNSSKKEALLKTWNEKRSQDIRSHEALIFVPDVEKALTDLACAWRAQFDIPVVGITGSVGKTSTKEMLATILTVSGKKYVATKGNQNTVISVAATLLGLRKEHDCAIIEMGINKRGEMARLAALVLPTLAVITSVAHSHMEGLGSLQDIALEKRDIFKYFKESNIGIINGDQPILASISYVHPVVKFGCKTTNQVQARKVMRCGTRMNFLLKLYKEKYPITVETIHSGRMFSALACAAIGHFLGIPHKYIVEGIQNTAVVPGRFQPCALKNKKGLLIDDCYNANPESMKEALLAFERLETAGKKIAVLGDMLELGVNAPFWHRQLGRVLRKAPSLDRVIFVGEHIKAAEQTVPRNVNFITVPTWEEAVKALEESLNDGPTILVKASNSVGLKNLVARLVEA
jgi:UDP-N-acetylmuramoyl-tripeptide--D-alanyl-D-alanine ligase